MKYFLTLMLIGIVIAGCSSSPGTDKQGSANNSVSGNTNVASIAPEGKSTENVATSEANSSSPLIVMTVNSPPIQLVPLQGNLSTSIPSTPFPHLAENWQTFTIATLGVAIDYPMNWSILEQTDGAIFTSPLNTTIQLKVTNANNSGKEIRIGNRRCTSRTNAYDLTTDICVESASFNYSAQFTLKAPDGTAQWLTLTTTTRDTGKVFEAMINSVRPTP